MPTPGIQYMMVKTKGQGEVYEWKVLNNYNKYTGVYL